MHGPMDLQRTEFYFLQIFAKKNFEVGPQKIIRSKKKIGNNPDQTAIEQHFNDMK